MGAGMNERQISPRILQFSDPETLAREAARFFAERAGKALEAGSFFRVALSGGTTPKSMYSVLADAPFRDQVDWSRVQVFFSDERFVPPDSPESNYRTAYENLLSKVPIPERFVHPVATEDVSPEESASLYVEGIRRVFEVGLTEVPRFDLILLGLGPDGHTASLFPGSAALSVTDELVAPNFVEKFDQWRITFTYPLINAGRAVAFLAQGKDKAERVQQVMAGDASLPASGVHPTDGELMWLLDREAASLIDEGTTSETPSRAPVE